MPPEPLTTCDESVPTLRGRCALPWNDASTSYEVPAPMIRFSSGAAAACPYEPRGSGEVGAGTAVVSPPCGEGGRI